jgi:hypothetical protein
MNNKGTLTINEGGIWMVKWSDLHSFTHGTHWSYTELSSDSNSIKYIKDGEIRYKPLEEGLELDFEIVTTGYDEVNFTPINFAKLIFPEVETLEKEQWIKEYVIKGNLLFSISDISTIRDGGTIMLYNKGTKQHPFYIHKDNWTLHNGYPTTDDNLVTDKSTQVYILDRLQRYKENCEFNLKQVKTIIEKLKQNENG